MDMLTGESAAGAGAQGANNRMDEHVQPHGEEQSDEECPRYMLAGRLSGVDLQIEFAKPLF